MRGRQFNEIIKNADTKLSLAFSTCRFRMSSVIKKEFRSLPHLTSAFEEMLCQCNAH